MNWKLVRHFCRGLIYIPLAVFIVIALLVGTPVGSQITVSALNILIPQLKVSYQSGTLNKTLHLKNFGWNNSGVSIASQEIALTWQPHCLVQQRLCITDIKATKTLIKLATENNSNKQEALNTHHTTEKSTNEFQLPFGIIAQNAHFQDISVFLDEQKYASSNLEFSAQWLTSGLIINQLSSTQFSISGVWPKSKPTTSTTPHHQNHNQPIRLPQVTLPFQLTVHNSKLLNSQLELDGSLVKFKQIMLDGVWRGSQLRLKKAQLSHSNIITDLNGEVNFSGNYPLNIKLLLKIDNRKNKLNTSLPWLHYVENMEHQLVTGDLSNNLSSLQYSLLLNGDITAKISGAAAIIKPNIPFSTNIKQLEGKWKLEQGLVYASKTQLTATGDLDSVNLKAKGHFKTPFIPQVDLNVAGKISDTETQIKRLIIKSSSGNINATGVFAWKDQYLWDLNTNFEHFRLKMFGQKFSEKIPEIALNGRLISKGKINTNHWQIGIKDSNLTGSYNSSPLLVKGSLELNSNYNLNSQGFIAKFMGNELQLARHDDSELQGKLIIQELSTLVPPLSGSISSDFISYPQKPAKFDFKLIGHALKYKDYQLETIKSSGNYFPLKNHYTDSLTQITNLSIYKQKLRFLQVKSQANLTQQSSEVTIHSKLNAHLKLNSKKTNTGWSINLPRFDVFTKHTMWQLNRTINANWSNTQKIGTLNPFCLLHNGEGLCLNNEAKIGTFGNAEFSFNGELKELTKPYLPKHLELVGKARITTKLEWQKGQKPSGNLFLQMPSGTIRLFAQKNEPKDFSFQSFSLFGDLSHKWLSIKSNFKSQNLAHLNAELNVGVEPEHPLNGILDIKNINFAPITEFFPAFRTLNGNLSSKLKIFGTLKKPLLDGGVSIKNAELVLANNPTRIHALNADLVVKDQNVNISSKWNMDEGNAALTGTLNWKAQKLFGKLTLKGNGLSVIKPPWAILTVNPDMHIDIDGTQVTFTGKVSVPDGTITITPLPKEGTPLSDDVVFVNQKQKNLNSRLVKLVTNLDINVSDKVAIKGMGLAANLGGKISLRQKQQETPLLFGSIKVLNGSYRFLGQTLNITDGNLEFIGPPTNPNINIIAVKSIQDEDLTVGVKITGPALKPNVQLFSNPVKEQAEIVSYLFQGHSFFNDDGDNSNNSLLLSAALTIGKQAGNNPISSISNSAESVLNKIGLKNVQLNANDEGKVAVSGYIGDRLLVKYGYGVFNPGYELSLRFYLLSQLYLETVSSAVGQSLDIYYRFSFN
ncbi:hypothetical protein D5018_13100 [Parashewanella curva]|uniref:Translocation and assembly module TamB C-terminal domain-containing protein n=1 Tax=Parashewanella curva TaxID=2338552 RepID=A0A3L8PWW1_9GAMM|nr:translocation/assembly module TamB domain-containing protein [Parashewanella curva]RLV59279.1 hypothetical protein D5018_13100 [Parashewanella curva]